MFDGNSGPSRLAAAAVVGVLPLCALAQEKVDWSPVAPDLVVDEVLPNGTRRVYVTDRVRLTAAEIDELLAAGKADQIDPATGERVIERIVDHLPVNWGGAGAVGAGGERVDSYGNRIVNEVDGLPGWAQWNVDALRSELKRALARARDPEGAAIAGNYLGQAIVRDIPYGDIVNLWNRDVVTERVAASTLDYLHFYENLKLAHAEDGGYAYRQSVYGDEIARFAAAHGRSLADVLAVDQPGGLAGRATPSGCYTGSGTFTRGFTALVGETSIWDGSGGVFDDRQSDVPIGFPFYFYACDVDEPNANVRVSTNGYITFIDQGAAYVGVNDGTDFTNDAITDTTDPSGYAAPFWDDFIVTNQGIPDQVGYLTEGASGDRVFTVEWFSVSRLGGDALDWQYFQVKLYERTQNVEFHYGVATSFWDADSGLNGTIGLEDFDGMDGDCGPSCANTNADAPVSNQRFAPPRPVNDNCSGATLLGIYGGTISGDLVATRVATQDGSASCGGSSTNPDVWYSFRAPCNGTLTVSTCGTHDASGADLGMDTVLALFDGCGGAELTCDDDAGPPPCPAGADGGLARDSVVTASLTGGQAVLIRVSHFGSSSAPRDGDFTLNWGFAQTGAPPSNDDCANARQVVGGTGGNLSCATNDGTASCGSSGSNRDVWYRFTAPCAGTLDVDTSGSNALGGIDTTLALFSGCGAAEIQCNDDAGSLDSAVSITLAAAQSVLIRVSHFGSTSIGDGAFQLNVSFTRAGGAAPANDACSPAAPLIQVGDTIIRSTCNATIDSSDPNCAGATITSPGVWYRTLGNGSMFTADTCGAGTLYDTKISVYAGACGSLVCLGGNDDALCGWLGIFSSRVSWPTLAGEEYSILVHGFGGQSGQFQLSLTSPSSCPCDLDGSPGVNVFDLLAYLDLWFPMDPGAEFNGVPGIDVFDLLAYLDCWFPASAGGPCP